MRKISCKKVSFVATMAAAAISIQAAAAEAPLSIPAHFAPNENDFNGCVNLPAIQDEPYWEFGNYWIDGDYTDAFACYEDYNEQADSWLILPQLATEAGGSFTISYSAITRNFVNVGYSLCWGTAPTPEEMTNVIYSNDTFSTGGSSERVEEQFTVPTGQNIYIGYHLTTVHGCGGVNLKIFDITVSGTAADYPTEPGFSITTDGLKATATIEFPATTVAGNDITAETMIATIAVDDNATYTVEGDPGAVVPYEFSVAAGTHTAVCTISYDVDGTTVYSKPVSRTFAAELPDDFTLDLPLSFTPSADAINMLKIFDMNDDGKTWQVMETYPDELRIQENWKMAADDWAILPAVEVTRTGKYKFTLRAAAQSANCPESVELCLGTAPVPEAMKTTVLRLENFTETRNDDSSLHLFETECFIETPGKYYIGIHAFSQKDMLTLSVGTVTMEKTPFDYLDPEEYATLPADMFEVNVSEACQDGIRFSVKANEQIMIYTNAVFDKRYITEDKLTDEDFAEQILKISNQALAIFGSWENAQKAEFFYFGDRNIENAIVNYPGSCAFVAVLGLEYNEQTNTVRPVTRLCRSEIFEYTDLTFTQEEPWADMVNPVYIESKGKKVVHVDIVLNPTADEAYGKGFAPDHRDHNSDYEIIQYLTSYSNMPETLIFPMHLEVALEPGERSLLCVTTTDRNGRLSKRLNWMLVEAPSAIGQPVKVLATATDSSGIGSVAVSSDAHSEYFDIQGRRIDADALTPGIYIRRTGSQTSKVIVR